MTKTQCHSISKNSQERTELLLKFMCRFGSVTFFLKYSIKTNTSGIYCVQKKKKKKKEQEKPVCKQWKDISMVRCMAVRKKRKREGERKTIEKMSSQQLFSGATL